MDLKSTMRKAAGLLVELPPEQVKVEGAKVAKLETVEPEELLAAEAPVERFVPSAEPSPMPGDTHVSLMENGRLNLMAIYRAAHLPEAPFGAEQMLEALDSLPADLPLETRRITVRSLLGTLGKTLGATPDSLIEDATRKRGALGTFAHHMQKQTDGRVAAFEREIAELQAQIETLCAGIEAAQSELATIKDACAAESEKLDDVLEFFSTDAYPSKQA